MCYIFKDFKYDILVCREGHEGHEGHAENWQMSAGPPFNNGPPIYRFCYRPPVFVLARDLFLRRLPPLIDTAVLRNGLGQLKILH